MRFSEIVESKTTGIAAQLDSNGNEVKVTQVNTGAKLKKTVTVTDNGLYRKVRNTANTKQRYQLIKSSASNVWLDKIDADGKPIDGHSGKRADVVSRTAFQKDFEQIK